MNLYFYLLVFTSLGITIDDWRNKEIEPTWLVLNSLCMVYLLSVYSSISMFSLALILILWYFLNITNSNIRIDYLYLLFAILHVYSLKRLNMYSPYVTAAFLIALVVVLVFKDKKIPFMSILSSLIILFNFILISQF